MKFDSGRPPVWRSDEVIVIAPLLETAESQRGAGTAQGVQYNNVKSSLTYIEGNFRFLYELNIIIVF